MQFNMIKTYILSFLLFSSLISQVIRAENSNVCRNNESGIKVKAKIICKIESTYLDPKNGPGNDLCFGQTLVVTECKKVPISIKYKLINKSDINMTIVPGSDKTSFFFDGKDVTSDVKPSLTGQTYLLQSEHAQIFTYVASVDTCSLVHDAKVIMKLRDAENNPPQPSNKCAADGTITFSILTDEKSSRPTIEASNAPSTSPTKSKKSKGKTPKNPKGR